MQAKTGVIFLQKERFQVYSPYLPNILEFRFVPELIRDFDLISRDLLENLLKVFVTNNKIPASNLVIVIGDNASFIKDFILPPAAVLPSPAQPQVQPVAPQPTLEDLQNQANQYLEHIPFEVIASKTFPLANGIRAFATNQELYDALKSCFEKLGFIVEAVIPSFAFGQDIASKQAMDGQMIMLLLQKLSTLREYNLLKETANPIIEPSLAEESSEKDEDKDVVPKSSEDEKKNRMLILVAISGIVIIIMITASILYYQFTTPPYKPPAVAPSPAAALPIVSPTTVTTQTQSSTVIADAKDLTVQVISASVSATRANAIKTSLTSYNFKSVDVQTNESVATAQTLVIFSPKVNPSLKTAVTEELKKIIGEFTVQEKADALIDIVVTLGQ